ncbi:MAG: DUF3987 domain-containing protein [Bacteroidetes bacterium]|jgi:hypothetical protein|nr:DUF3987 domain-containing protein [Bacteroidota bacterium]
MEKNIATKQDLNRPEAFVNHFKKLLNFDDLKQSEQQNHQIVIDFPVEVFPEPIRQIIKATNYTLKYPIDYTAASILFAASVAIGNTNQVEVKKGWTETAVLYLALVGRPGTNKSHPLSFALAPLMAKDDQSYFEYTKEKAAFDQLQNQPKDMRNGQELIKPILKKHLVSDTTPEALVYVHNFNNRGIGVYVDELAGWFKSFNRYHKGSEQEFWLSNWSGKPVIIDRKTSDSVRISRPFISVCGTIQTSILDEMAKGNRGQNGFIDRILFVLPVFPLFYEDRTLYGSVTFIENKFLITAAHCFFDDNPNPTLFPGNFYIGYQDKHVPLPEPLYRGFIPKKETHESPLPRESFRVVNKN